MHPGLIFVRFCGVMSGLAEISPLVIIFYSLSVEIKWNNPCNKMAKILMDYNSSKLASNIRYPRRVFCYQESCLVFSRFMYLNTFFALYQWETTGVSFLTVHSLLFFTIILPLIFLVVPLKYTSPRSCEVKCKMSHWGWPSDPTLGGYIRQTQVPFFSICLTKCCCEIMFFWADEMHYDLKGPTLVCSSQKLIILTLGSGVFDTPCWLLQAVPPPKCQMLLCLLSDLICHLYPPWGRSPIIKLWQDYPHHPQLQVGCHSSCMARPPATAAHAEPRHCLNAECQC